MISGHDTNLSNLSGMLELSWLLPGYQADDAPPGGALVFSLWKSPGGYSVRLQFAAQTLDQMHDGTALSRTHPPAIANVLCRAAVRGRRDIRVHGKGFGNVAAKAIVPGFAGR